MSIFLRRILYLAPVVLSLLLVADAAAQCRVCAEWQGAWMCVTTPNRIKCVIDGPDCTMTLVTKCTEGSGVSTKGCLKPKMSQGALLLTQGLNPKGTLAFPVGQSNDPLLLREVTFKAGPEETSISGGSLLNQTKLPVVRYMLGFGVVRRGSTTVEILPGLDATPTMPINPGETRGMYPQAMEIPVPKAERAAIGVFVLEVQFADGSSWKPGLDRIKAIIQDLVARQTAEPKQSKPTV